MRPKSLEEKESNCRTVSLGGLEISDSSLERSVAVATQPKNPYSTKEPLESGMFSAFPTSHNKSC